eukprot:TRINITY_DN13289_c0_g1_i1.p1 TRINITY_DN13289_c0_g1~~TRINITY_DN13289_c0_g1_i1.p1  ORF type:complete len:100 (+),score=12.31 TRINITY_DN13289_c0_g1_i1:19-318(+)
MATCTVSVSGGCCRGRRTPQPRTDGRTDGDHSKAIKVLLTVHVGRELVASLVLANEKDNDHHESDGQQECEEASQRDEDNLPVLEAALRVIGIAGGLRL